MNLYLKYRPKTIDELDLTSVRESLMRILKSSKIGHAYLFTGPRGAGKTSAARILARVVNCEKNGEKLGEPCNECSACQSVLSSSAMDVIEIDAASNRGIDDVRELKEKIGLSPSSLRKKVYIIDEVHMMTTEAFNALLKTLEEPPEHALFVLCTTEAHKVPETIASRCVRILFTKATSEEMVRSFARVVAGEKAEVSDEALELLASSVDGSFRDGIKILDQVLSDGQKVELEEMQEVLSGSAGYLVDDWAGAMEEKNLSDSLEAFRKGVGEGVDMSYALVELMKKMRDRVVDGGQVELVELVYLIDETITKQAQSPVPEILVEMMIVKWCGDQRVGVSVRRSVGGEGEKKEDPPNLPAQAGADQPTTEKSEPVEKVSKSPEPLVKQKVSKYKGTARELWRELAKSLNGEGGSFSLGALLAKARPGMIQGDLLTIQVDYDFHRDQIMAERHRAKIEQLITVAVGQPMRITCEVRKVSLQTKPKVDTISQSSPEESLVESAIEIFT